MNCIYIKLYIVVNKIHMLCFCAVSASCGPSGPFFFIFGPFPMLSTSICWRICIFIDKKFCIYIIQYYFFWPMEILLVIFQWHWFLKNKYRVISKNFVLVKCPDQPNLHLAMILRWISDQIRNTNKQACLFWFQFRSEIHLIGLYQTERQITSLRPYFYSHAFPRCIN